jgi:small-conductance mechanosensitive channel
MNLPAWASSPELMGPATLALTVALGLLVKTAVSRRVRAWTAKTETQLDDILLAALDRPLTLLIVGTGLVFMTRHFDFTDRADGMILTAYQGLLILASILFADRFLSGMVDEYAARQPVLSASRGIVKGVARAVIYGLGALVFLGTLGIAITPVLASLGVGSLAVALALQEPLSNLFSGLSLLIDKPIHPGHYIHLEGLGVEGFVEEVGWRATKIRNLQNNLVLVPNARLVGSVITNFDRPEKEMLVPVPVSVAYGSDLARVEAVTLEVMRQVMEAHGLVEQSRGASVIYTAFGDSGICFDARLIATGFAMRPALKSAFIQALHVRYRAEGVEIPYPTRTILTG